MNIELLLTTFRRLYVYSANRGAQLRVALPCLSVIIACSTEMCIGEQPQPVVAADASIGETVCRPGGKRWTSATSGVLLVLPECSSCGLNRPFEEDIVAYATAKHLPVVYILSESRSADDVAKHLVDLERLVLRVNLKDFGVTRSPAILRVTGTGVILSMWTGAVPLKMYATVRESLIAGKPLEKYTSITYREFRERFSAPGIDVISLAGDTLGLGGHFGLHQIPLREMAHRSATELDSASNVFVLCSLASQADCQQAAIILAKQSTRRVYTVGLIRRPGKCQ